MERSPASNRKVEMSFMNLLMKSVGYLVCGLSLTTLASCTSIKTTDYAQETPKLVLEKYLNGRVEAFGMVSDRSGKVTRRFTVTLNGTWNGTSGILDEDFVWSDGEKQKRIWKLTKTGESTYEGRADDVVGVALGESSGNAFRFRYVLRVPVGQGADRKTYDISVDDWMYLINDRVLLNRSVMSKFGFRVGEVTLSFLK